MIPRLILHVHPLFRVAYDALCCKRKLHRRGGFSSWGFMAVPPPESSTGLTSRRLGEEKLKKCPATQHTTHSKTNIQKNQISQEPTEKHICRRVVYRTPQQLKLRRAMSPLLQQHCPLVHE